MAIAKYYLSYLYQLAWIVRLTCMLEQVSFDRQIYIVIYGLLFIKYEYMHVILLISTCVDAESEENYANEIM